LPHREPCCAGASYPADADALRHTLDSLSAGVDEEAASGVVRGLLSPHIDYDRGGETYARVWKRAARAAEAADLVILLGTDHCSEGRPVTLTHQHYGSPLGLLPTDSGVVDQLVEAIGPEIALGAELHHRGEHSIELAAVWLQHVRKGKPCPLVPVLCGSFDDLDASDNLPEQLACVAAFINTCRTIVAERRTLVVAAGDLAHVGPAFGGRPVQWIEQARLQQADAMLLRHACAGDAQAFYREIQGSGNARNVCGLPPIYYALRILEPAQGDLVSYQVCPADQDGTSFVSIAGLVWT
jgi:AmmeMemoRadiSam system protein B